MGEQKKFVASEEAKAKAKQLRMFAILAWIIAIAGEVFAIFKLISDETLVWLIVAIVVILALSITGSLLWKKSNKLDPASEKDKFRFFVQNQLGAIMAAVAFLPLIILIFMNKDASKQTKGIAGAVGVVALLVASIVGIDFNPASIEKYTQEINEQTDVVKDLVDVDNVYWSRAGNKYHIYEDCQHIKGREGVTNGTVKQSWDDKGISELCLTCEKRAIKNKEVNGEGLMDAASDIFSNQADESDEAAE